MVLYSQRRDPAKIPRPEGRRIGHLARAIRRGWWALDDGAQRGRHQCDTGRVRARLPLNGRLGGLARASSTRNVWTAPGLPACALPSKQRRGDRHGVDDNLHYSSFPLLFIIFLLMTQHLYRYPPCAAHWGGCISYPYRLFPVPSLFLLASADVAILLPSRPGRPCTIRIYIIETRGQDLLPPLSTLLSLRLYFLILRCNTFFSCLRSILTLRILLKTETEEIIRFSYCNCV